MTDKRLHLHYLRDTSGDRQLLGSIFARLNSEHTFPLLYFDGAIRHEDAFIADVLHPGSLPFLIFWEGRQAGFCWFNTIRGRSAYGHFVFFREFWGHRTTRQMGRAIFSRVLTFRDQQGYLFDVLLGLTPRRNALAWRLALLCGAQQVGVIPCGIFDAERGKSDDAMLVAVTRASLGITEQVACFNPQSASSAD